jgi:hypothetical protein
MDRDLDPQYSQYVQQNLQVFNDTVIKLQHQHGTLQHFLSTIDQHIENITHELFSEAYDSELRFGIMEHESRAVRTSTIPQAARELILERIRIYFLSIFIYNNILFDKLIFLLFTPLKI